MSFLIIHFFFVFTEQKYAAIDLGSQYIRIAISSNTKSPSMAVNEKNKVMTPAAIAFKLPSYSDDHMTMQEAEKAQIKIGEDAEKLIKSKPLSGARFLPRLIGREETDFAKIPKILNTTEMITIMLKKILLQPQYHDLESFAINVPNYYTLLQRNAIIQAINFLGAPFYGLIDDTSAIIQLYAIQFSKRFIYETHSVLFVDIGASAVRAYRIVFTATESTPIGKQTSYEFSEKTGGISFIRKIAEEEHVSFNKAQKMLISGNKDYSDLLFDDLEEITKVVQDAIDGEIDEVQLIGGASRFPFVIETIQKLVGYTDVLKDMPMTDSIALGTIHVLTSVLNMSRFKLISVTKPPIYSAEVICGTTKSTYCTHRKLCEENVILQNAFCKRITVIAHKDEICDGCSSILSQFELKNISNFQRDPGDNINGLLVFQRPSPYLAGALWCSGKTRSCTPIEVEQTEISDPGEKRKEAFIDTIIRMESNRIKRDEFFAQLHIMVDAGLRYMEQNHDIAVESGKSELQEFIDKAQRLLNNNEQLEIPAIRQLVIHFEKHLKKLGVHI